jgi:probable phosphomutase (TIGR03848 family)
MTMLVLVRHGTTAATGSRLGGHTDAGLDEAGRAQAEAVAERLAGVPLRAVYASPLQRTIDTAAPIAAKRGLAVQPCPGVIEVDYGDWTDRPLQPLARTKLWPTIQTRPSLVRFPGGETIRGAQLRAAEALEEIVAAHKRTAVVVVSHADIIKAVVAFYLGQPLDLFQRLHIAPASITMLQLDAGGGRPMLLRLNDDGPLVAERFRRPRTPSRPSGKRAARGRAARG